MDETLEALYDAGQQRGGLGGSNPKVARWLGDIRRYFPTEVVQVMQKDAIERLDLKQLLLEPEILQQAEPDIHLVSTLISLNRIIPEKTRETARMVVRKLVDQLMRKLEQPTRQAVQGALSRSTAEPPAAADGNRLAPDDPRESAELSAGVQNDRARNTDRLRQAS